MHNISTKTGDITKEKVCAIVNAANSSLMGGGGVDGAIHSAGGHRILEECRQIRKEQYPQGLPTGECVATNAGDMPSKYVIHPFIISVVMNVRHYYPHLIPMH